MNSSQLKFNHELNNPQSYFFTRKTMRFFGDSMKNYAVKDRGAYYELIRKTPVKHGLIQSAYFDKTTFQQLHNIKG